MNEQKKILGASFLKEQYITQEQVLSLSRKNKSLRIGIPNESEQIEYRVPLTPQGVEMLVHDGHEILIESLAGEGARYSDLDYADVGAIIVETKKEVYQSDVIVKVGPFELDDIDLLRGNQTLFSNLYLGMQSAEAIRKLIQKKVTAIAFEYLGDSNNCFPIVRSMSEITGNISMAIASEYLSTARKGKGVMLGGVTGITPAEVVIIGAGIAAEYAARNAIGLGCIVKVFDSSIYQLRDLQQKLGLRIFTSVFQPSVLEKALRSADVVLGAQSMNGIPSFHVPEEMIKKMKPGSVIIDLNIIQGGSFETSRMTTHSDPVFEMHNIIHYCVPNIPSRVSRTASIALSNIIAPILQDISDHGGCPGYVKENLGFRRGVYIYNGILTNPDLADRFSIPYKNIDLLLAAYG